jgi:hypothetical protein
MLAPRNPQVRRHPLGQADLVVVDQDHAVGPARPQVLVVEQ